MLGGEGKKDSLPYILFGILILGMLPWLYFDSAYALRTDVAWHILSSARYVDGGTMSQDLSETNPPLIILAYAVPALIAKVIGAPLYYFPFYMMLILNVISAFLVHGILRTGKIADSALSAVITSVYFIGLTLITAYETGQREHLVITGLMPFFMAGYAIDKKAPVPKALLYSSLIFGGIFLLIKPHFGLLPALVFVQRIFRQGLAAVLKAPDFIILSLLTASYIAVCLVFFMDYVTQIFPDVIKLYVPYGNDYEATALTCAVFAVLAVLLSAAAFFLRENRSLALWIVFASLVCLVSPFVQGKGFIYHFLPTMILQGVAIGILTYEFLRAEVKQKAIPALLTLGMFFMIGYTWHAPNPEFPTHKTYAQLPFPKMLDKYASGGSFVTIMDNVGLTMPSALYSKADLGSRHPSFWFLIAFAQEAADQGSDRAKLSPAEFEAYKQKYIRLMVEDLRKYKPELISITKAQEGWPEIFKAQYFLNVYGQDKDFLAEWEKYEFFKEVVIPKKDYFGGLGFTDESVFTIYKRKD